MVERRKYPRIEIVTQQRILRYTTQKQFVKSVGLTRNVSPAGVCFRTSRAYDEGDVILVYLDEDVLSDLKINRAQVFKSGNYFMAQVVWFRPSQGETDPFHEVGCAFLERSQGDSKSIELFTRLVNHFTAENLANS